MDNLKIVLDTNIFVSAIFWKGIPYKIVRKAASNELVVFASGHILNELQTVLARDFGRSKDEISNIIDSIKLFLRLVEPNVKVDVIKADPPDDRILECALECNARYIISQDNHLLKLKDYKNIKIVTPKEFLDIIE